MTVYKTDCQYCGKRLKYTNTDTEIKCYTCLTTHYRKGIEFNKKENLVYTLYPYLDRKCKVEKQNAIPNRNRHTV